MLGVGESEQQAEHDVRTESECSGHSSENKGSLMDSDGQYLDIDNNR